MKVIYDLETFKSVFLFCGKEIDTGKYVCFEISNRRNDAVVLRSYLDMLIDEDAELIGFNNVYFDYPILHKFYDSYRSITQEHLHCFANEIITDRFKHAVWPNNRYLRQIDLYLINHFDNVAKRTSLKALEFAMRMTRVQELPYAPDADLSDEQIEKVVEYGRNDIEATENFYYECIPAIDFRRKLSEKYNQDFTNHNDVKIGKDIFVKYLEERCPGICYKKLASGQRLINKTYRDKIQLSDIIFDYINFNDEESLKLMNVLKSKTITETKGVFKNLTIESYGPKLVYGTGGLHGSVKNTFVVAKKYKLIDSDVSSFYPNISIQNNLYPEHLGSLFVDQYFRVYQERKKYAKGTLENGAYKLVLNGTYGNSNSKFSPFYDPAFTMSITINGQLLLTMLIDMVKHDIKDSILIQANTDGVTFLVPPEEEFAYYEICKKWEELTRLELEHNEYQWMCSKDVNNYIALYKNGKVKTKGVYSYKKEWHQDHSSLVIAKAVYNKMINKIPVNKTICECSDKFDFMIRARCNSKSFLSLDHCTNHGRQIRYYIGKSQNYLFKHSPPLKNKINDRWFAINKSVSIVECNNADDFDWLTLNYKYYIDAANKLINFKRIEK